MNVPESSARVAARKGGRDAEALAVKLFADAGWGVRQPWEGSARPDMIFQMDGLSYLVEVKMAAEGRADRLVPLWAHACLVAMRAAGGSHQPLAVVAAPVVSPRVADQVLKFAEENAPGVAAGVIDFQGLRRFRGSGLSGMDAGGEEPPAAARRKVRTESAHLFSDLNQWMLKVLLAPELPEELLAAPRARFRNASQLAGAAKVSVMSAFRLVQQLQRDGYLHESAPYLRLVRREELFRRWQAASMRRTREVPMRFLLGGDVRDELRRTDGGGSCLALFAAADALHLGFVHGVPPYVYVDRLGPGELGAWKRLVPAERHESPDLIMRQAPARESVFRGMVRSDGVPVCDVLQVWLDVSAHPSRGQEQAELIRRRVLDAVIQGDGDA